MKVAQTGRSGKPYGGKSRNVLYYVERDRDLGNAVLAAIELHPALPDADPKWQTGEERAEKHALLV